MGGTRVTIQDIKTGETESMVIEDDYVLVVNGKMKMTYINSFASGATITVRRDPPTAGE